MIYLMSGNIEDNISNSYNSTPITPKIISLKMNPKSTYNLIIQQRNLWTA